MTGARVYGVYDDESGEQLAFATADAHGLYAQFGFEPVAKPEHVMERWVPGLYLAAKRQPGG